MTKQNQLRSIYNNIVEKNIADKLDVRDPDQTGFDKAELAAKSTTSYVVTPTEIREFDEAGSARKFMKTQSGLCVAYHAATFMWQAFNNGQRL